jgi:hypothetical protein
VEKFSGELSLATNHLLVIELVQANVPPSDIGRLGGAKGRIVAISKWVGKFQSFCVPHMVVVCGCLALARNLHVVKKKGEES